MVEVWGAVVELGLGLGFGFTGSGRGVGVSVVKAGAVWFMVAMWGY